MTGTILVTGGTIGDSVADGLTKKGRKVRVTAYKIQSKPVWAAAGIEQVEIDYARPETLDRAFEGVEAYFSLSPLIEKLAETGIQGVKAAKRAGVKRIVRSSVLGAADDGITFPRWHRAVERAVEESGLAYTILQPTAFMQNCFFYADSVKKDGKFYAAQANSKASLVDTRDIAEAAVVALTEMGHEGKKYKLTGGEALSNFDIAKTLSEATGKPVEYVAVSDDDARQSMTGMGMPAWMVNGMEELNQIMVKGWLEGITPDFERLTGRKPRTFRNFAQDFRAAFV